MATHAHTTSNIGRVLVGLAVLWGIIGLALSESDAHDEEFSRVTLRGLAGVYVMVIHLEPDVERAGLTKQQLQTDVELRLRQAGIRVLTQNERLGVPGAPMLEVLVTSILREDGLCAYRSDVSVYQRAYMLETDTSSATVSIWSTGSVGTVGVHNLSASVRGQVRNHVDRFINAYLSVNPRPASSTAPSSASPRRDLVRQVQERLQTVGFNPGTIDGSMGPQTSQALRSFQNAQGLRATGDLDEPTLNALGVR
jgi:Putative peptidoglycan binding domain